MPYQRFQFWIRRFQKQTPALSVTDWPVTRGRASTEPVSRRIRKRLAPWPGTAESISSAAAPSSNIGMIRIRSAMPNGKLRDFKWGLQFASLRGG
jgi:hypothetical protein